MFGKHLGFGLSCGRHAVSIEAGGGVWGPGENMGLLEKRAPQRQDGAGRVREAQGVLFPSTHSFYFSLFLFHSVEEVCLQD